MENWAKIFQKISPKHVQNTFGYFWEQLWAFLEVRNFFLEIFEDSTFHGKVGKEFSKSLPQNLFKTRLDTFRNDFGRFWNFEISLSFFEIFRRLDPPWKTGQNFFGKIVPNYNQNTFGFFWEPFWAFLEF